MLIGNFFIGTDKNYYHQVFLEECKYLVFLKKKIPKYIIDDRETFFDSDWENFDEENENSNEGNLDEDKKTTLNHILKELLYFFIHL